MLSFRQILRRATIAMDKATNWIYDMFSNDVIVQTGVSRGDDAAALAEVGVRIDMLSPRVDAVDAQTAALSWAVTVSFMILAGIVTTARFRKKGWWPNGNSGAGPAMSRPTKGYGIYTVPAISVWRKRSLSVHQCHQSIRGWRIPQSTRVAAP